MTPLRLVASAAVAASLLLAGCSTRTDADAAGAAYLEAVCPSNDALSTFLDAYRSTATDDASPIDEVTEAAGAVRESMRMTAELLDRGAWPEDVAADVAGLADSYFETVGTFDVISRAGSLDEVSATLAQASLAERFSTFAERVRSGLDLPADSASTCAR